MAWGLFNKIKNGIKKVGALLKPILPVLKESVKKGLEASYNVIKKNQNTLQKSKPLKKIPLNKIFNITDDMIQPIFK